MRVHAQFPLLLERHAGGRWPSARGHTLLRFWLDNGLDSEQAIVGILMTIDIFGAADVHSDFHLFWEPEISGAACKLVYCIRHLRSHPSKRRNGSQEVGPHTDNLVIDASDPGHTLYQQRYGAAAHEPLARYCHWPDVFGEGDDLFYVDGAKHPQILGTGTEDYFNGAWDFGGRDNPVPFAHLYNGAPFIVDAERTGGRYCLYRWHADNPIVFTKYLKYTIEHGHANHRADNYFSVAYWYQAGPYTDFPELPSAESRIPRLKAVPGPGGAQPA